MNKAFKRFASFMLALVLVMCTMPLEALAVKYLETTVLDGKITVTTDGVSGLASAIKNEDGSITVTTTATSNCSGLGKYSYTANPHTVTITNSSASETVALEFQYQASGLGTLTIDGENKTSFTTGTIAKTLAPTDIITVVLTSPATGKDDKGDSATITFSNFTEKDAGTKNVTVKAGVNATVSVAGTAITADKTVATTYTDGVAVSVKPADGYEFIGWQDANGKALSTLTAATINPAEDMTVSAVVVAKNSNAYWLAGEKYHTDLTEACAAAQAGDKVVVLLNNGTLSGQHTIPADVTVLIPYNEAFTSYGADPEVLQRPSGSLAALTAFRTLTLAAGAKVTVAGKLEVVANHYASHGGQYDGGRPVRYYGHIAMSENSEIVVAGGGKLFAWGYITGSGSVTAKSGAEIYEKMQITDYRGGTLAGLCSIYDIFPFNQYYVQNVEVMEIMEEGSSLLCHAGVYADGIHESSMNFMGSSDSMFTFTSGTVTKRYDVATDKLILDFTGSVSMRPITFNFAGTNYDTSEYSLPLNHNFVINIHEGSNVTVSQSVMMQPGATVNVAENTQMTISEGTNMYIMDADNWGNYCFGATMRQIKYVASRGGAPVTRTLEDAKVNMNGNLILHGQVYTSEAGAQVVSEGKTATVSVMTDRKSSPKIYQSTAAGGYSAKAQQINMVSVLLRNGDGTTVTTDAVKAGSQYNYCATCDKWYMPLQVTYDANAGVNTVTGEMAKQNLAPCHDKKLAKNLFESESMNFKEWNTAADGKGTVYADEGELTDIKSNVLNLFAQWIVKATWMKGSEKLDETDVLYNTVPAVTEKDASKPYDDTYHYQTGWSTTPDGEAQDLTAITAHTTYYAVYTPVEHSYSLDTTKGTEGTEGYEWSADGKSCTAHAVCSCGKTITASAVISSAEKTPAACETKGTTTYTATFADVAWAETKTLDVEDIPALNHKDEDHDHNCDHDDCDVAQGEHADGTDADHKCDYCGEDGLTAHVYNLDTTKGSAGYAWAEDGKSCTAYGKCVCGDTVELAATMSSSVTTPGTCKTEEVVTWKAAFAETWATEQSKPVTGMKNMENHAGTEVTYSKDGMTHSAVYNCCGSEFVTGQEHTFEEGKCICGADEPVKGDVDLDGKVEASDLTTLCRHVAKIEYVTDEVALHNADVTGDGVLAADDLTMLARYVAKIIDSLD